MLSHDYFLLSLCIIADTPKYVMSTCNEWLMCSWSLGEIKAMLILLTCVQGILSGWNSTETFL